MRQRRGRWTFSVPTKGNMFGQVCTCVSIVAVVFSIIAPIFAPRHESTHLASCMSNMKQLGLGLIGYSEDYDDKFPSGSVAQRKATILPSKSPAIGEPAALPGQSHGIGVGWAGGSSPYIKSTGVFKCPEDKSEATTNACGITLYPVSYAMNQWIAGQSQDVLAAASSTVLAYECSGPKVNLPDIRESGGDTNSPVGDGYADPLTGIPGFGDAFDTARGLPRDLTVNNRGQFARHDVGDEGGSASLYLFCDGHVKFLRYDDVSVGKNPVSQSMLGSG